MKRRQQNLYLGVKQLPGYFYRGLILLIYRIRCDTKFNDRICKYILFEIPAGKRKKIKRRDNLCRLTPKK